MHRLTINPHHLPTNTTHHRITYTEIETTPHFHHNHNMENPMKETENKPNSNIKNNYRFRVTLNNNTSPPFLNPLRKPRIDYKNQQAASKSLLKTPKQMTHNLSAVNLRNPECSPSYPYPRTVKGHRKTNSHLKTSPAKDQSPKLQPHKQATKQNYHEWIKKTKQTPSFIKRKTALPKGVLEESGLTLLKKIDDNKYLAKHNPSQFVCILIVKNKKDISLHQQSLNDFKLYAKNSKVNHNLIVKQFGILTDPDRVYFIEEYVEGCTLDKCIQAPTDDLNESTAGPIICSILTAITYLHRVNQPYSKITPENIIYSMNICKLKRELLTQSNPHRLKDYLFDIWCVGKIAYQLVTHKELISKQLMDTIENIDQIFSSKQIAKCIEVGFKRFEETRISRELIQFLIATLWTIQNKEMTLKSIWNLQFVKLYQDDDLWRANNSAVTNDSSN